MKNFNTSSWFVVRLVVVFALLIPLIYTIYKHWLNVRAALLMANWLLVIIGLALLMLAQPLMGLISWVILRHLNQNFSFSRIFYIYFVSQAAKYLPGGIWAFPSRVLAYKAIGVENSASLVSMVREVGVLFIGAAVVGLTGLFGGLRVNDWVRVSVITGVVVCTMSMILIQLPLFWHILERFRFIKNTGLPEAQAKAAGFSFKWVPVSLLISLTFWALTGIAFREMASGISVNVMGMNWFQAASIFALAWCAGFVIVIAPAGLGIRETVLSALLSSYMPISEALSIALIARLWWTLGEAFIIVFSIFKVSAATRQLDIPFKKEH